MTTRSANPANPRLTPRMVDVLERIHRVKRPPMHTLTPREARLAYLAAAEVLEPPRAFVERVEDFHIPAADGAQLAARLYAPAGGQLPIVLFLHGGGFVIGGIETHDSLCRQLALASEAAVVALDYRLAPEHRFPVAVDDSWAALHWLAGGGLRGLDASRLAVAGDSAGATLAAVAALHARDAGIALALQVLITPGTSAHQDSASHRAFASGYLLEQDHIEWFFDHYIDRSQRSDWRFAPLLADDLSGVAPACVILAEADPLVDEGLAYAWPTPTVCVRPGCRSSWSSRSASRMTSSRWAARFRRRAPRSASRPPR